MTKAQLHKRTLQIFAPIMTVLVLFGALTAPVAYARTASDIEAQNIAGPWFSSAAEDCAAGATNSANPGTTGQIIVLDPGHAPGTDEQVDPDTNIAVLDSDNEPEMPQVWTVAQTVARKLIGDGYTVAFTKSGLNDATTDLKKRTRTGYQASIDTKTNSVSISQTPISLSAAVLGVSIHTTPAAPTANAVFEPDPGQFDSKGVHAAGTGNWRITSDGKTKKYYGDLPNAQKLATADKADGQAMADARKTALGGANVQTGSYDSIMGQPRDTSTGSIHSLGTVLISQYFATIPWVYNEQAQEGSGSISGATQAAYANGIIAGIENIVPIKAAGASTAPTGTNTVASGSTSITMDKVDLSAFKPDPVAVKDFNSTGLPQIKKFLPQYIQAAQAEGVPQNWEILPALMWPESGFADSFQSNSLGYTGPYQEGPSELAGYLGNKTYDPPLNTLVTSGGSAIQNNKLTDAQFVILSRLVFKHWVSEALGSDYAALKSGPVAFNPVVSSSNTFWKIMHRWNSGAEHYEGFNGYNTTDSPMGLPTEYGTAFDIPGAATTYYMIKQWEASGGLSTITVASTPDNCTSGAPADSGAVDCASAAGNAKIICEAKKYDPVSYSESAAGNHYAVDGGNKIWLKTCPTINASCYLDCSGLVSIAVYDAFGLDKTWVTFTIVSDSTNWQQIPIGDVKPGDVVEPNAGHVEIVDHVKGTVIYTFGAHTSHLPQPEQVGPDQYNAAEIGNGAYRYIGKGAGT